MSNQPCFKLGEGALNVPAIQMLYEIQHRLPGNVRRMPEGRGCRTLDISDMSGVHFDGYWKMKIGLPSGVGPNGRQAQTTVHSAWLIATSGVTPQPGHQALHGCHNGGRGCFVCIKEGTPDENAAMEWTCGYTVVEDDSEEGYTLQVMCQCDTHMNPKQCKPRFFLDDIDKYNERVHDPDHLEQIYRNMKLDDDWPHWRDSLPPHRFNVKYPCFLGDCATPCDTVHGWKRHVSTYHKHLPGYSDPLSKLWTDHLHTYKTITNHEIRVRVRNMRRNGNTSHFTIFRLA